MIGCTGVWGFVGCIMFWLAVSAGSVVGVRFVKVAGTLLVTCGLWMLRSCVYVKVATSITLDLFVNFRY